MTFQWLRNTEPLQEKKSRIDELYLKGRKKKILDSPQEATEEGEGHTDDGSLLALAIAGHGWPAAMAMAGHGWP